MRSSLPAITLPWLLLLLLAIGTQGFHIPGISPKDYEVPFFPFFSFSPISIQKKKKKS